MLSATSVLLEHGFDCSSIPNYYSLIHWWVLSATACSGALVGGQTNTAEARRVLGIKEIKMNKQKKGWGTRYWIHWKHCRSATLPGVYDRQDLQAAKKSSVYIYLFIKILFSHRLETAHSANVAPTFQTTESTSSISASSLIYTINYSLLQSNTTQSHSQYLQGIPPKRKYCHLSILTRQSFY